MRGPFLETAIVKAMQRDSDATADAVRAEIGCAKKEFDEAVKRLRWAGKMVFGRAFALSPSMLSHAAVALPPAAAAKGPAGKARREDRHAPADLPLPGGPTIAAKVKAEAADKAHRRTLATKISTGLTPLPSQESLADRFRRLAIEMDEEELEAAAELEADERRQRDLERLPTPSAVLRRAQRDWPAQCGAVQALAVELGVSLGEAWRRTIAAGVDCIRESGDEGAVA